MIAWHLDQGHGPSISVYVHRDDLDVFPGNLAGRELFGPVAESLTFLWGVYAVQTESDLFTVVQDFDGVAIGNADYLGLVRLLSP